MSVQTKATIASFGGKLLKLTHNASTTNCEMGFNLYLPPQASIEPLRNVPLLIYLAGLTCTGDNGAEKGFFQHKASEKGIAVLYPDTSPRGSTSDAVLYEMLQFPLTAIRAAKIRSSGFEADARRLSYQQAVSKSKPKTTPTTSAPVQPSTSMPPSHPGTKATRCTATSPPSYQKPFSRTSSKWTAKELASSGTAWADMVP